MKPLMDKLRKEKIERAAGFLREGIYRRLSGLEMEYARTDEPVAFAERLKYEYRPIREGERWAEKLWDCAWFHVTGEVPAAPVGTDLYLVLDFDGEGCIFDASGMPVRGITNVSSDFDRTLGFPGKRYVPFTDGTFATDRIDLWIETGNNDLFGNERSGTVIQCGIASCDTERRALYYDYMLLMNLMTATPESDPLHYSLAYALEQVALLAMPEMSAETVRRGREILAPELSRKNASDPLLTFYAAGHSHLDLAWLWPIRESRRKVGRTFSTALANLRAYPDYVYGASQPQQFAWVKEDYPALYEKVKEAVKDGRFEIQGGMWVEADTNVTGAESLVRQFLYGTKFWKEEFGRTVDTLWLPDVFGFSGALPQILRGCNCENFLTIKLSWNMVNEFPYHSFRWQGIDGSEVLVHMPPEGTYNSSATPKAIKFAESNYGQRGLAHSAMMLYGIGDGGGGPGREHLEYMSREHDLYGMPNVVDAPSTVFFRELRKEADRLPIYKGEIYLEKHQGTYTSQSDNKYYNRRMENALVAYELAQVVSAHREQEHTDELWKEVLLYQFHDILPGSSIQRVYTESVARYKEMYADTAARTDALLARLGDRRCALNTTSYCRKEWIKDGAEWHCVEVAPYSAVELEESEQAFDVYADANVFGNGLVEVRMNADGSIASVTDKTTGRELLRRESNTFVIYDDAGDAWDFYHGYTETVPERFVLESAETYTDGAEAGVCQRYVYGESVLTQKISVTQDSPLVRCDVTVDWRETRKMLRSDFVPAVDTDQVVCDIQWGNVKRSMLMNNGIDNAQYEVCAHKWVDMSDGVYGVSLINDSKYGYRCKQGVISVDLLRSQVYPCADEDKGVHSFSYALYGHAGTAEESQVAPLAYAFNRPLIVTEMQPMESVVATDNVHAVVETVKPAEDGHGIIVRVYNDTAHPIRTTLYANGTITETDMLEEPIAPVDGAFDMHAFQIKTFRIV